jgi:type I restriction enzyme, S subunit
MEVREPGARYLVTPTHQQTELGELPVDWLTPKLGEITRNMHLGGNYKNGQEMSPWPLIKMGNLGRGSITLERLEYIDSKTVPAPEDRLRTGDVLFNTRNTLDLVGKVAIWRDEIPEAYFNSNIARIEFDRAHVASNACMAYMLNTPRALTSLRGLATGTTSVAAIYGRDLVKLKLPLPPKTEQVAIAGALGDADSLIESLEQLLAKKRQIKQGAMQELLSGQRRLPGFAGQWNSVSLRSIADIRRGASPRPIDSPIWFATQSTVGWVRISDVTRSGMYLRQTTQRLSALGIQNSRKVERGSLIMSICATVGRPVITDLDVCIHDGFVVFDGLTADPKFMYYVLSAIEPNWSKSGQTGSQMNLNTELIKRTEVPMPMQITEQSAIATTLSDMDAELTALQARLAKARQLKQGMAQALLTGRIRLG